MVPHLEFIVNNNVYFYFNTSYVSYYNDTRECILDIKGYNYTEEYDGFYYTNDPYWVLG